MHLSRRARANARQVSRSRHALVVVARRRDRLSPAPMSGTITRRATSDETPTSPSTANTSTSYSVLEGFFYGRAFATVLSARLSEVLVDVVSEVSKAMAEQPKRIQEFQDEVSKLVRADMQIAGVPMRSLPSPAGRSSSGTAGAGSQAALPPPQDVEAVIDDIRAEVAYSRALVLSIKQQAKQPPQ